MHLLRDEIIFFISRGLDFDLSIYLSLKMNRNYEQTYADDNDVDHACK